eukprot:CAMPEP_0202919594 /NCGR_PEP_ID=MMETSP1392-20130828/76210_1 /ASSEMBLY_ACC=CAM_ASM_000868 /TAXON_ID=225041 /ORGANISM="Chlamydomonas chlamydogama, Strain SAG 11-48b" /LENGTH=88 /DNA_ID=CAMNT_0049613013 /DNA_START=1302 /DNA_END=1568 /DNA_ORIENTATION=-
MSPVGQAPLWEQVDGTLSLLPPPGGARQLLVHVRGGKPEDTGQVACGHHPWGHGAGDEVGVALGQALEEHHEIPGGHVVGHHDVATWR